MKPRTYFGLALLFPYVLWILCALALFVVSPLETSAFWNAVVAPVFFYALGVLFWFIPYTILAIGLWFWSRGKSTAALYKAGLVAPLLLIVLMLVEVVLISLPVNSLAVLTEELVSQSVMVGVLGLVFGYLCVGIVLLVYRSLRARKLIEEEMPTVQTGG
jgi:Na+/H+-translocating membrane pyrophosphatase